MLFVTNKTFLKIGNKPGNGYNATGAWIAKDSNTGITAVIRIMVC
jgi:hypothetical protein